MATKGAARTLGDEVFGQIRDAILAGRLEPGSRLRPTALRVEFDASVSVIREALTRLAEQQLVVAEPNLGFSVPSLTRKNLIAIIEARTEIEGYTFRLSVERGDLDWETGVLAAHHRLERTSMASSDGSLNLGWSAPHAAFHAQLLAGCGNATLTSICATLFRSAELYRRWSDPTLTHRDTAVAEHRAITEAALAHDADRAVSLLREHIERTRDLALQNIAALRRDD